MAKQLQLRRGTTIQNEAFTGAMGELTLDTDTGEIRVHDGVTQGGAEFIDAVVAFQKPTAENGYTWFRKYASGWVEQGGIVPKNTGTSGTITLPVEMADVYYTVTSNTGNNGANNFFNIDTQEGNITTTTMTWYKSAAAMAGSWQVSGMAA